MKIFVRFSLFYLSLLLVFKSVNADQQLIFVGKENYPPFSYLDDDKNPVGIDVDIINEAIKVAGINAKIDLYPWPRVFNLIHNNKVDGVFGAGKNKERLSFLEYPEVPIRYVDFSFFINEHYVDEINGLSDLGDEEVGLLRNYFISEELENNKTIDKFLTRTSRQLLTQVSLNRRRVAIYSTMAGRYELFKYGIENLKAVPYEGIPEYPSYLAFVKSSKKDPTAAAKISSALRYLKENGYMEKIYEKYR